MFSFGNGKVIILEFTINPKNYIYCTGSNTHFFRFITKPRCCNRKIAESLVIKSSLILFPKINKSSRQIMTLIIRRFKAEIGIFNNFLNIVEAGPNQNIGTRARTSFLPEETGLIFLNLCNFYLLHYNASLNKILY